MENKLLRIIEHLLGKRVVLPYIIYTQLQVISLGNKSTYQISNILIATSAINI